MVAIPLTTDVKRMNENSYNSMDTTQSRSIPKCTVGKLDVHVDEKVFEREEKKDECKEGEVE